MYEEVSFKERFKLIPTIRFKKINNINLKSLLVKLLILILLVFIICFIIFKPKKVSLENNIKMIKIASISYFQDNKYDDFVRLKTLYNKDYLEKQYASNGKKCSSLRSKSSLDYIDEENYKLTIYLKCGSNKETKSFNIKSSDLGIENDVNVTTTVTDGEFNFSSDGISNGKYKHIKYGSWHVGKAIGNNVETSSIKTDIYKYCNQDKCVEDSISNYKKYQNYTLEYIRTDEVPTYRLVSVVWSNANQVEGYTNTGIIEYK